MRYAIVIEQLEEITGTAIERVHAIGGGIQNRLLCQFTADATGRPVIAGPVEATAMGNIIVQAIAKGDIADWATARSIVGQSVHLETYMPTDTTAWREQVKRIPR